MQSRSLMEVMNDMAVRPETVAFRRRQDEKAARPKNLKREIAAFILIDPLLCDLHKHHADAKNNYRRLLKLHGARDPMTEVACDMADSTRSAFDTRLLEVQRDKELRRLAFRKMKEMEQEEFEEQVKASKKIRTEMEMFYNNQFDRDREQKIAEDRRKNFAFTSMLMWLLQFNLIQAQAHLSLMDDFARANQIRRRKQAGAASW